MAIRYGGSKKKKHSLYEEKDEILRTVDKRHTQKPNPWKEDGRFMCPVSVPIYFNRIYHMIQQSEHTHRCSLQ